MRLPSTHCTLAPLSPAFRFLPALQRRESGAAASHSGKGQGLRHALKLVPPHLEVRHRLAAAAAMITASMAPL